MKVNKLLHFIYALNDPIHLKNRIPRLQKPREWVIL
jgi:hypothetical protein